MIRLVVILLVCALGWMTWWAFGQIAYEKALTAWIEDRRADGWAADLNTLETAGFPNRFDTTVTDLALADPQTGVAWTVPEIQLLSLAYKPNEVIAVLPSAHRFSTPVETVDIAHEDARASLFLGAAASLPLESARLVVENLAATSNAGWTAGAVEARFAIERLDAMRDTYRIGGEVSGLLPAREVREALDPTGLLPETIETMHVDAKVAFDAPWNRYAIEDRRPQPTRIELTDLSARWGDVLLRAAGEVDVDDEGYPDGRITIRAEEWRQILDMAIATGVLPEALRGSVEAGMQLMSGGSANLDVTLEMSGGTVRLGLIPLGQAPRMVIR